MPRRYVRKSAAAPRAVWSEEALKMAAESVTSMRMSIHQAGKKYGIPARTLRRRIEKSDLIKHGLGKAPLLGYENEKKLVAHIHSLQKARLPCTGLDIRKMAYELAEKYKIEHKFNDKSKTAGKQWFQTFLERHPSVCVKTAGVSFSRGPGFHKWDVERFFHVLRNTLEENDLSHKPHRIFNVGDSRFPMNNKPQKSGAATKGSKSSEQDASSEEEEELVTLVACNSAVGRFLPPVLIMKRVRKMSEFTDGLPFGTKVYMNQKSAYMNPDLFLKWLVEHFIPRKPPGKVLLLLDGHTTYTSNVAMLEKVSENDIILLGLPSHPFHSLQPLHNSFFKPLETYFARELYNWILCNKKHKISTYQVGLFIGAAWGHVASDSNALDGFRACGIYPFNPQIIPDYYYNESDIASSSVSGYVQESILTRELNMNTFVAPDVLDVSENEDYLTASEMVPQIVPIPSTSQQANCNKPKHNRKRTSETNRPDIAERAKRRILQSQIKSSDLSKPINEEDLLSAICYIYNFL